MKVQQEGRGRTGFVSRVTTGRFPARKNEIAISTMSDRAIQFMDQAAPPNDADSFSIAVKDNSRRIRTKPAAVSSPHLTRIEVTDETAAGIVNRPERFALWLPAGFLAGRIHDYTARSAYCSRIFREP